MVTTKFELNFFTEFSGHLYQNYKKKNQVIWIKLKNNKKHTCWQKNQCPGKKSEREVCLLFWLDICSVIGACFIPILVLKFQLKIIMKTSAKTRGFLSLSRFLLES